MIKNNIFALYQQDSTVTESLKKALTIPTNLQEVSKKKGGEGSRGGRVIGHTRSGNAIYDSTWERNVIKDYNKHYSIEDHRDAMRLHFLHAAHHHLKSKSKNKEINEFSQKILSENSGTPIVEAENQTFKSNQDESYFNELKSDCHTDNAIQHLNLSIEKLSDPKYNLSFYVNKDGKSFDKNLKNNFDFSQKISSKDLPKDLEEIFNIEDSVENSHFRVSSIRESNGNFYLSTHTGSGKIKNFKAKTTFDLESFKILTHKNMKLVL